MVFLRKKELLNHISKPTTLNYRMSLTLCIKTTFQIDLTGRLGIPVGYMLRPGLLVVRFNSQ